MTSLCCYEIRSRLLGCWQYYLHYFPVFPVLCYLFVLGTLFTDCKNVNVSWIILLLVSFHTLVLVTSFVYFSWITVSDFWSVFVQSFFTLFVFFTVTFIIGNPYTCVIDNFSYAVAGIVFFFGNLATTMFSYWFHRHDDYPYYAPLYYQYSTPISTQVNWNDETDSIRSDVATLSRYDYESLIYTNNLSSRAGSPERRAREPPVLPSRPLSGSGIPNPDYISF